MRYSVKYNGVELNQYIDVLEGFTPRIGGDWSPVLSDEKIKRGADFAYTSYKQKTIPMPFTIFENLQEKYDALQKVLNVDEPKTLIFEDEPNRVFYAIPSGNLEFDERGCLGTGKITWIIPDGLSHSLVEKSFPASVNAEGILEATIINNGTESVPIDYTITHNHENGYIGIVSEHGVIQLGKVEEADGEDYKKSELITNCNNYHEWSSDSKWVDDKGMNGQNNANTTQGTMEVIQVGGYDVLALKSPGLTTAGWNGAMKTIELVGSTGKVGSENVYVYANSWFETGLMGQTGAQTIAFLDENNKMICSQSINKSDTAGNTAWADFWIGGNNPKLVKQVKFTPSYLDSQNPYNFDRGHSDMRKDGDKITFYWWGSYLSVVVPELKDVKVAKVQLWIGQYGARSTAIQQYVTHNYFRGISVRCDVEHWCDVPNRYQENDTIFVDGSATKVYVNGMIRLGDEVKGSKYFLAPPGETKIQFGYSDFCETAPSIEVKIREAWL